MPSLRLNQITLAAKDMAASVLFYEKLGLKRIVDSAPRYVRFEFPDDGQGTQATLSLHTAQTDFTPTPDSYLWFEADIEDPSGNRIRLFTAGENRRFPPWRIKQ